MRLLAALAACLFAGGVALTVPSPSHGGGYGYKHHHGYKHHYRHGRHFRHGHRFRHYRGPRFFFGFSSYGYRPYYRPYYRYPYAYRLPRVIYTAPPVQQAQSATVTPRPAKPALPEGCRMVREYQTKITVGGKQVDAYGDACLMPDDTWLRVSPPIQAQY